MQQSKLLVINPGSTSTKLSIFQDETEIATETLRHTAEQVGKYTLVAEQIPFREELIREWITSVGHSIGTFSAIVARGGNIWPVEGGTYAVNEEMAEDLRIGRMGQHASNLGGLLAYALGEGKIPAYIVDPVVADELEPVARISGSPLFVRTSQDHPLNQKAIARKAAKVLGGAYQDYNFIVAHMGGGISVGTHRKGRLVDDNNCLSGDGPMSPERCGTIPFGALIELCYSGKYEKQELLKKLIGGGGLVGYLGTNNAREVEERIENGDEKAKLVYEAMAYQVAKDIGAAATVLNGEVDGILLTGGLAHSERLTGWIRERVQFIANVSVYPGEGEMEALAQGALRVLRKEEEAGVYDSKKQYERFVNARKQAGCEVVLS